MVNTDKREGKELHKERIMNNSEKKGVKGEEDIYYLASVIRGEEIEKEIKVEFTIIEEGDGLDYLSSVCDTKGELLERVDHGFSSGYTYNEEELVLIGLIRKYPELAESEASTVRRKRAA